MMREWEQQITDHRDHYDFTNLLDEIAYQADARFSDYIQYQQDRSFLMCLEEWLENLPKTAHKQALLKLFAHLVFIDDDQMTALYRDAFRRVIGPWISLPTPTIDEMLAPNYEHEQRRTLSKFQIAALTESCDPGLLLKASDLTGLPRPILLGPTAQHAKAAIEQLPSGMAGLIACEDIIGTGKQAGKILKAVESHAPPSWRILFVPLIAFEAGIENLTKRHLKRTSVQPVVVLPSAACLRRDPNPKEPHLFKMIRGLVKSTAERVLRVDDEFDDPPTDPFGYEDSGGLIVTCHNAPNNTLPLIHHKSPEWRPLFRRLHHKERQ